MTPEERKLRAKLAAQARWSRPGARSQQSTVIRDRRLQHYEQQVDPNGELDPEERRACAKSAASEHMTRLRYQKARQAS